MSVFKNFLLCAYSNGVITVFDLIQGQINWFFQKLKRIKVLFVSLIFLGRKVIEIRAHAKWINSIDIRDDRFVSAGEDCMFKVWQLSEMNGKIKVIFLFTKKFYSFSI